MQDYFDFYNLDELFFINEIELKQAYLKKSKENHPDFHIGDDTRYEEALEATSTNNQAYKALNSLNRRVQYILHKNGLLDNDKNALPPAFLMQMMDVNEEVMDLQMEPDAAKAKKIKQNITEMATTYRLKLQEACATADKDTVDRDSVLKEVKEIYLKQKYVLRLIESVDKFAVD